MEHTFYTGADCTCTYAELCWVCRNVVDGGLAVCKVCGGGEGSLTTDCCGRQITEEESDRIYNKGNLDFRDGQWIDLPNPTNQMWGLAKPLKREVVPMEEKKQNSTSIIVRLKEDPSKQMQVVIDFEKRELGVVHSSGLELLVIETAVIDDIALIHKVPKVKEG
jgi:hypothetical protein